MGRVKTTFSCDWQEVNHAFRNVFSCFYVVHEGQFYCDFEISSGFTVYSWHVGVRKRFLLGSQRAQFSAATIFSGDLYIFAKYAPVFSNRAFPTTFTVPPIATAMCERTSKWRHSIFVRFLGKMLTDREHWQIRERYYPTPPHPPHPTPAWRDTSST